MEGIIRAGTRVALTATAAVTEEAKPKSTKLPILLIFISLLLSFIELGVDIWALTDFGSMSEASKNPDISELVTAWMFGQLFDVCLCISKITYIFYYCKNVHRAKRSILPIGARSQNHSLAPEVETLDIWSLGNGIFGFLIEDLAINVVKTLIAFESEQATEDLKTFSVKVCSVVTLGAVIFQAIIQSYAICKTLVKSSKNTSSDYVKSLFIIFFAAGGIGPVIYSFGITFNIVSILHDDNDFWLNTMYLAVITLGIPIG